VDRFKPEPPSDLAQWMARELEKRKGVEPLTQGCLEVERRFYGTVFEPYSHQVETPDEIPWTNTKAWNFILNDYVGHVAWCDNGFHKIPEMKPHLDRDDAGDRFVIRLQLQSVYGKPAWVPFGAGLLVKKKGKGR
jgi:hypothetical protein